MVNWKMIIHFLFTTYKFGVNNEWWCDFKSIFGRPWYRRINPYTIWQNYLGMRFRVKACYFVPTHVGNRLFK